MHRRFSHDLYVVAKTDPMKFDHDPRYLSKLVSGAAEGKFASAPQQLCSAFNQGRTFRYLFGRSHFETRKPGDLSHSLMSEPVVESKSSFVSSGPFKAIIGVLLLAMIGVGVWWWLTQGRESTDDAQVDAHVIPMSSRVGGTVLKVPVVDNQVVEAGTVLLEIDPRDYQVAVDKARAERADAEATAIAAQSNVPITATTAMVNS